MLPLLGDIFLVGIVNGVCVNTTIYMINFILYIKSLI